LGEAVQQFVDGDRDLALRKQLAAAAFETARDALAAGERKTAIRAAARSLALDPQASAPAELVGRLMIEPPTEMPPEVEREIAGLDRESMSAQIKIGSVATLAYIA